MSLVWIVVIAIDYFYGVFDNEIKARKAVELAGYNDRFFVITECELNRLLQVSYNEPTFIVTDDMIAGLE